MARLTVFPVILLPCRQRVQIFFEPTMFRLKEWSSRYDAWVSAGGEVEEEGGGDYSHISRLPENKFNLHSTLLVTADRL